MGFGVQTHYLCWHPAAYSQIHPSVLEAGEGDCIIHKGSFMGMNISISHVFSLTTILNTHTHRCLLI